MQILVKERFLSGALGRKIYVTRFLKSWLVSCPWGINVSLCLTAILLKDRFVFYGFFPFLKKEMHLSEIKSIEHRKAGLGFRGVLTLIPKAASAAKICFFVRKPHAWLEHFKKLQLRVEHIEALKR